MIIPPTTITAEDAASCITAQTSLLHDFLTPDRPLYGDNLPHGYHSDDGSDYLSAALDIASELFPLYIDLPYSLDSFIFWLDELIAQDLADDAHDSAASGDTYDDDPFPNFACDAVTTQLATLYAQRYNELTSQ